jgi:hypothetical protein
MHVCIYVCMYVYTYINIYACISAHRYFNMCDFINSFKGHKVCLQSSVMYDCRCWFIIRLIIFCATFIILDVITCLIFQSRIVNEVVYFTLQIFFAIVMYMHHHRCVVFKFGLLFVYIIIISISLRRGEKLWFVLLFRYFRCKTAQHTFTCCAGLLVV